MHRVRSSTSWSGGRREKPLAHAFLRSDNFASTEPWASLMRENTPGVLPPEIPVFIAQGTTDALVLPRSRAIMCTASAQTAAQSYSTRCRTRAMASSRSKPPTPPWLGWPVASRDCAHRRIAERNRFYEFAT